MSNVSMYDTFFVHDAYNDWGSVTLMILSSAYTYSSAHVLSDVQAHEVSDVGYSRISGATLQNPPGGTPSARESDYFFQSAASFAAFTTSDWRYVVGFDANSSDLYFCIDNGTTGTLTDEALDLAGVIFTLTG